MKKCLLLLLLWLPCYAFSRQLDSDPHYTDSLEQALDRSPGDTARAKTLFLLSWYWSDKDSSRAVAYAQRALRLPLDPYFSGLAYFYLGAAYFDYDVNKAEQAYRQAAQLLEPFRQPEALVYRSRAWANIGAMQQRKNNNREYIDLLLNKAIPLAGAAGDSLRVARQYMDVGLPFMNFREYDKAIFYYQKAIDIFRRHQVRSLPLADCYANAAKAYLLSNRTAPAKPLLDSAWAILQQEPPSVYHTYYYCQEALYYTHLKAWEQAAQSLEKGLALARSLKKPRDVAMLLFGYVDLYTEQRNLPALRKALLELHQDTVNLLLNDHQQVLLDLATTDAAMGHMQTAYDWLWQYTLLTDSINKAQFRFQLTELEAKYNYAEKEKEVLRLHESARMQRLWLWGSIGLLLLAVLLFIYLYKQRKQKAGQALKSMQQRQQIVVAQALLDGEERERGRLARDLHDGLGGTLASVKINLSEMSREDNPTLQKAIRQLDNAVTELRHIARNLMPETLLRSGLETALKDLCQSVTTDKMSVELQLIGLDRGLSLQVQLIIYRIVQELLANVLKHAAATEVFIQCSQSDGIFYITIED
ncbi:MAG TPA: histidine kinase, partial [Chitinophaga sp.]